MALEKCLRAICGGVVTGLEKLIESGICGEENQIIVCLIASDRGAPLPTEVGCTESRLISGFIESD